MSASHFTGKLLLTGGRGRLASVIRRHYENQPARLTSVSRAEGDGHLGLEKLLAGDLLGQADVLLHLAWSTVPATSERHAGLEWEQDLPLLFQLLEAVVRLPAARRPHFVFFSSGGAVYGNAPGRPNREDDPCQPVGWYGHAKLAAEKIVGEFGRRHALAHTILRVSNPYGFAIPDDRPQGIIPRAIRCAREGRELAVWGDGAARKDFIHHRDFAAALDALLARRLTGVYNLCLGESHPVSEIIDMVQAAVGRKLRVRHTSDEPWDVHDSRLDNARLRAACGWTPRHSLREGIALAVRELA